MFFPRVNAGFPAFNEMHVHEVRRFGNDPESGRPVPTSVEHLQREDLHLPLVLAGPAQHHQRTGRHLPTGRVPITGPASATLPSTVGVDQSDVDGAGHQRQRRTQTVAGRLFPGDAVGTEPGRVPLQ